MTRLFLLALALALPLAAQPTTIDAVKAESNLEKRSEKALIYADSVVDELRQHLDKGHIGRIKTDLADVRAGVDLSTDSLEATGKNARRSPKWFKRAEKRLRELDRRLETLQNDLSVDDRHLLDGLRAHISKKIDWLVSATLLGS
jgi:hypothetical protein